MELKQGDKMGLTEWEYQADIEAELARSAMLDSPIKKGITNKFEIGDRVVYSYDGGVHYYGEWSNEPGVDGREGEVLGVQSFSRGYDYLVKLDDFDYDQVVFESRLTAVGE